MTAWHAAGVLVIDSPLRTEQDAVDAIARAWQDRAARVAVPVERLDPAFFTLSSGVAGAIVQKFAQYGISVALIGDIDERVASSGSLRAFVAEANRGRQLWFVRDLGLLALRAALDDYAPHDATEIADVRRVRVLLATEADPWTRAIPLHVTASALIVHPPTRRVLLRWHRRQQAWLQVGGHGDPGESEPLAVALREGREETGLADLVPWPDGALRHVAVVPVAAQGDEAAHEHADLRFVLATGTPDAVRPEDDHATLRWLELDEARALTSEPNVRESLARVAALW